MSDYRPGESLHEEWQIAPKTTRLALRLLGLVLLAVLASLVIF